MAPATRWSARPNGASPNEFESAIAADRLTAHGISLNDLTTRLQAINFSISAGEIDDMGASAGRDLASSFVSHASALLRFGTSPCRPRTWERAARGLDHASSRSGVLVAYRA